MGTERHHTGKLKIAIIRGDFANPWELQSFNRLADRHDLTLFTGFFPISKKYPDNLRVKKLLSPVDLNFGKISRSRMAILNRLFIDAHLLFSLENELEGFNIAHCSETYFNYTQQCISAKKLHNVKKIVTTVWENIPFNNEGIWGRKAFKQNSFTNIDLFLAVSSRAREALIIEGCPQNKIIILKPGIDLSRFKPIDEKNITFRGLQKNGTLKLLYAGRLEEEKGIMNLLTIYNSLSAQIRNVQLVIAGDGSLRETVERKSKDSGARIVYLGGVSYNEMPLLYNLCDIYVHPAVGSRNWMEQFGMVLVEAMACGLPVLASRSGSIVDVVGEAGIVTDVSLFKEKLVKLLSSKNMRREFSAASLARARSEYDAVKYSIRLEKIYMELLSK